jgi:uncharacterized membrane protein YqgA involved in biofilm formation
MILSGTLVNAATVVTGSLLGRYLGHFVPERQRRTVMTGLGLATLVIGGSLALQGKLILVVIGSLVLGGVVGESLRIEARLESFGEWLKRRFGGEGDMAEAFVTAALLYCVGAMAVMGSIQDGLGGRPDILYAKAALDGVASIALAAALGIGVLFSIIPLVLYQGGITLAASLVKGFMTPAVTAEMNAVGGLLIVAISFDLLGIRRLPVGNLLPALFIAPLLVQLHGAFLA